MRLKFYEKMINSLEKVETVTLVEKHDKSDAIVAITAIIRERGLRVNWVNGKWKVTEPEIVVKK